MTAKLEVIVTSRSGVFTKTTFEARGTQQETSRAMTQAAMSLAGQLGTLCLGGAAQARRAKCDTPCIHYRRGSCNKGVLCVYKH